MKTLFTEEYYEKTTNLDSMRGVMDLNEELQHELSIFDKDKFDDDSWDKLTKVYANKVIEKTTKRLLEDKKLYNKVRINKNCLGYTTETQANKEAHRIVVTFEYNCYKLSKFKKEMEV